MDKKPIYVKIEGYNEVLEVVGLTRKKVEQARKVLDKIYELKNREDSELESWKVDVDEIEKKMNAISEMLSEPDM